MSDRIGITDDVDLVAALVYLLQINPDHLLTYLSILEASERSRYDELFAHLKPTSPSNDESLEGYFRGDSGKPTPRDPDSGRGVGSGGSPTETSVRGDQRPGAVEDDLRGQDQRDDLLIDKLSIDPTTSKRLQPLSPPELGEENSAASKGSVPERLAERWDLPPGETD